MIRLFVVLLWVVVPSFALAQAGATLEGDVYVLNVAGDVKKAAGAVVGLVPRGKVQAAWKSMCAEYDAFWDAWEKQSENNSNVVDDTTVDINVRAARAEARSIKSHARSAATEAMLDQKKEEKIVKMIATGRQSSAGINAHYRFTSLPAGVYVLFSHMRLLGQLLSWVVPVTVRAGSRMTLDLDNSNVEKDAPSCATALDIP